MLLRPTCGAWKFADACSVADHDVAPHLWGLEAADSGRQKALAVAPHLWGLEVVGWLVYEFPAVAPHLWGLEGAKRRAMARAKVAPHLWGLEVLVMIRAHEESVEVSR